MASLSVFGKHIAVSGGPDILNECHIIEKGSQISFISGKRYKRTKRVRQLLALAMEVPQFQSFLESNEAAKKSDIIEGEIFNLETTDSCDRILSKETLEIFKEYEEYQKKIEIEIHGKTAQYWFGYVRMVQLCHQFIRKVRTGDLERYIFCLERMSNYFFIFNHPNYAGWLVLYHDNHLKLKNTHP